MECDERGRVTSLELTYPQAPLRLPETLEDLVALQSFRLVGNGRRPTGNATVLQKWKNLTSLDVQYTGLVDVVRKDTLQKSLRSLTLVSNPGLLVGEPVTAISSGNATANINGTTALNATTSSNTTALNATATMSSPAMVNRTATNQTNITAVGPLNLSSHVNLTTLVLSDQRLNDTPILPAHLTYLDLSYNRLTGNVPGFMLVNLQTAFFQHNNFTRLNPPVQSPVTSISVEGNTALEGWFWKETCGQLTLCDLRGTKMQETEKCAVCNEDKVALRKEAPLTARVAEKVEAASHGN